MKDGRGIETRVDSLEKTLAGMRRELAIVGELRNDGANLRAHAPGFIEEVTQIVGDDFRVRGQPT